MNSSSAFNAKLPKIICLSGIVLGLLISGFFYWMIYIYDYPLTEPKLIQKLSDFLILFSPAFLLLIVFIIVLKWEYVGGIILIITGVSLFLFFIIGRNLIPPAAIVPVSFAALISGMLFIRKHSQF